MSAKEYRQRFGTRWNDNDMFGHVNNTIYYAAMDTTITTWLMRDAKLDVASGDVLAVVVSSSCEYRESVSYPDALIVALHAGRVGTTSVTWQLELFRESDGALVATGKFVHVFIDGERRRPIPIPPLLRAAIEAELVEG
jgi:acyl-CoA thioester hydrolase